MSAVARPTFVVVASLLVHRVAANSDDDDDESNEHLNTARRNVEIARYRGLASRFEKIAIE